MDKYNFFNKILEYSGIEITYEKRLIEIFCNEDTHNKILGIMSQDTTIWLKNSWNAVDVVENNSTEYVYINGIQIKVYSNEGIKIPMFYFSNKYSYTEHKLSDNIESFYDKELKGIIIINKFNN